MMKSDSQSSTAAGAMRNLLELSVERRLQQTDTGNIKLK